jgi:predicted membrane chloride channel (bestrophin family)
MSVLVSLATVVAMAALWVLGAIILGGIMCAVMSLLELVANVINSAWERYWEARKSQPLRW